VSGPARGKGRWVLLGLATAAAAPLAVSMFFLSEPGRSLLPRSEPHGELLAGKTELPALPAPATPAPPGIAQWALVLAVGGPCGEECAAQLEYLRSAQMALGKSMLRVRRVLLLPAGEPLSALPEAAQAPPAATAVPLQAERLRSLAGGSLPALLVADPAGRLVMRYEGRPDFLAFVDDVEHLLGMKRH